VYDGPAQCSHATSEPYYVYATLFQEIVAVLVDAAGMVQYPVPVYLPLMARGLRHLCILLPTFTVLLFIVSPSAIRDGACWQSYVERDRQLIDLCVV